MKERKLGNKLVAGTLTACIVLSTSASVFAYTKEETVYSKTKNNGERYQTIVSEHLKNTEGIQEITDQSILKNIQNVNGDESFSQEENKLIWKAEGNDIYYQGETDKELPLSMKVTYHLNGEEILPQDLAGKSGKVEILLSFENKEKREVTINGKKVEMYIPFTVVSGMILDNNKAKNMEVKNGKTIDNGRDTIVMGMCLPGMQQSLGLEKDEFEIPSDITITFDATDFEMGQIMTYATPKLIEDEQMDQLDQLEDLFEEVTKLGNSSKELVQGSQDLKEGVDTLQASTTSLEEGAGKIAEGTKQLQNGAGTIANHMNQVTEGAQSLVNGGSKLSQGIEQIQGSIPSEQEIQTNQKNLTTLSNTNNQTIINLQKANEQIQANLDKQITPQLKEIATKIEALTSQIQTLKKAGEDTTMLETTIGALKSTQAALTTMQTSLKEQKAANTQLITLLGKNKEATDSSVKQLESMTALKQALVSLQEGTNQLEKGAKSIQSGSKQLQTGVNTLAKSSKELAQGANTLSSGTKELTTGTTTLAEGSTTLAQGMKQFDEEGIQKIVNLVNHDLKELKQRAQALQNLANEYECYGEQEKQEQVNQITKFIYITDEIKKKEDTTSVVPNNVNGTQTQEPEKNEKQTEN